jgi:hypothetical protein
MYRDADRDPELKSWFKKVDSYIRKCLKDQGFIMNDRATEEWNEIYDRGSFLLRDRYRNHTDRIVDEVKFLADQFDKDPQNQRFAKSMNKLFTDLGNDENGKPTFKPYLIKDLTEVIIPAVFENVRYIPIPRIEYRDPVVDFCVENLVIESDNFMPNILEVSNDNYFRWGRKNVANKKQHSIMVLVSGIQMDLKDVSYYLKKKEGFPSITDIGVLDIFLGGSGFSFKMKLSTADENDRQNFFKVDKVDVDVKNLKIKIKQSRHKFLFSLAKSMAIKTLRPAIQKATEKFIKDKIHELDSMAYQIKIEADRAMQEVRTNPENAQNIYQRYVTAAQRKVMQGKTKGEEVASKTTVNVAVTKQDSIFPDIHLPGGISSKATEYKELANKGTDWQSPIFTLGSAAKTTDVPHAQEIRRKGHFVNSGGVRGPQNIGSTGSMTNRLDKPAAQYSNGAYIPGGTRSSTTNGFSKQVDQAFGKEGASDSGLGVGTTNGHALPSTTNGTAHPTNDSTKSNWNTTLGNENPVLSGRV